MPRNRVEIDLREVERLINSGILAFLTVQFYCFQEYFIFCFSVKIKIKLH